MNIQIKIIVLIAFKRNNPGAYVAVRKVKSEIKSQFTRKAVFMWRADRAGWVPVPKQGRVYFLTSLHRIVIFISSLTFMIIPRRVMKT